MSLYWDCLAGARGVVQALPAMAGLTVAIRPALVYRPDEDGERAAIIAPRADLWESVPEVEFANGAMIDYPVLVAFVVPNLFSIDQFRWLADAREAARKALWRPSLAGVAEVFDADYEPRPRGGDLAGLGPPMQASVQQFTFRTSEARATP